MTHPGVFSVAEKHIRCIDGRNTATAAPKHQPKSIAALWFVFCRMLSSARADIRSRDPTPFVAMYSRTTIVMSLVVASFFQSLQATLLAFLEPSLTHNVTRMRFAYRTVRRCRSSSYYDCLNNGRLLWLLLAAQ